MNRGIVVVLLGLAACAAPLPPARDFVAPDRPASLECVVYARMVSGIAIRGDAWTWWDRAEGRYVRTRLPRPGAVLVFSRTDRLRLGHVSVVTAVIGPREVRVAHANWVRGRVAEDVPVIDVSPAGDWTRVRVFNGAAGAFGGVYRTEGFILPEPVTGS